MCRGVTQPSRDGNKHSPSDTNPDAPNNPSFGSAHARTINTRGTSTWCLRIQNTLELHHLNLQTSLASPAVAQNEHPRG